MRLIFIHGPAAAGKLTIGRKLASLTGVPLFHNHLVVDAVMAVHPFGSPEFAKLRHRWWLDMFSESARAGKSLIFTFAPEPTVPLAFIEDVRAAIYPDGEVVFVELLCGESAQESRIENSSRSEFNKLRSRELLREIRQGQGVAQILRPPADFVVDTEALSPGEAAKAIHSFLSQ